MRSGDLHIHTSASDGLVAPAVVARQVAACGLDFFALADHNSLAGLPQARAALPPGGPQIITGVELSAQPGEGEEVHVLGYGVDPDCPALSEVCRELITRKREQILEILSRLRAEGIDVDPQALALEDLERYPGRPALAELLVSDGVVRSAGEAFGRYLSRGAETFVPMQAFSPALCIEVVHQAGGLAVLAHPFIAAVDRSLRSLVEAGLDGIEVHRPTLTGNEQLYIEKAAEHFGLVATGGSDWHGRGRDGPIGKFSVTEEMLRGFFERLGAH
jgi:predicted metal-dependent phosphoesterase TrpH